MQNVWGMLSFVYCHDSSGPKKPVNLLWLDKDKMGSFDLIFPCYYFIAGNSENVWKCSFFFKIHDSDRFTPYDIPPTLVLSPETLRLDLFTFCLGSSPLKRKCDLDHILLNQRPNKYQRDATWGKCELKTWSISGYLFSPKKSGKENNILFVLARNMELSIIWLGMFIHDFSLLHFSN